MSLLRTVFLVACSCMLPVLAAQAGEYRMDYVVEFVPDRGVAMVRIGYEPGEGRVSEFDFSARPSRYRRVEGDGSIEQADGRIIWSPPEDGGELRFEYRIDRQRRGSGYDARITPDWVIVRGDHLIPAAAVTSSRGASSRARLRFVLPAGWSAVETAWPRDSDGERFIVDNPERRFDRPTGWMIAGELGIRRESYGAAEVAVAAPRGDGMRRNEILGMTNLVLPEMRDAFGELPERILVVGAGDPMWRGGLSGPNSLYMHSDRPLISENATSTLVHELVHMVTRVQGREEHWIAEGTAEYYSLEMMRRVGLISQSRFERALDWMRDRGKPVRTLRDVRSHGPVTARAVTLFHQLDVEIQSASDGERSLDDLMRLLMEQRTPTVESIREAAEEVLGRPSRVLRTPLLD